MRPAKACGPHQPMLHLVAPRARNTDPPTSHASAAEIARSGKAEEQCEIALGLVRLRPGLTSFELAVHFGVDRYVLARRLPELRGKGLVRNGEDRRCKVSGREAMTWIPR